MKSSMKRLLMGMLSMVIVFSLMSVVPTYGAAKKEIPEYVVDQKQVYTSNGLSTTYSYKYDKNWNVLSVTGKMPSGWNDKWSYTYDKKGNVKTKKYVQNGSLKESYSYKYNSKNQMIKSVDIYYGTKTVTEYKYNKKNLVSQKKTKSNVGYSYSKYSYDKKGNLLKRYTSYDGKKWTLWDEYKYDKYGYMTYYIQYADDYDCGYVVKTTRENEVKDGLLVYYSENSLYYNGDGSHSHTYEYDENRNLIKEYNGRSDEWGYTTYSYIKTGK